MNDARTARDRIAAAHETIDRGDGPHPAGSAAVLAQTTTVSSYPTSASAVYACHPAELDGNETEGASATVTAGSGVFYAWNAGASVPPSGTTIVCEAVGGRWVFRYDG